MVWSAITSVRAGVAAYCSQDQLPLVHLLFGLATLCILGGVEQTAALALLGYDAACGRNNSSKLAQGRI